MQGIKIVLLFLMLPFVAASSSLHADIKDRVPQKLVLASDTPGSLKAGEPPNLRNAKRADKSETTDLSDWLTVVGLFLTAAALFYAATQVKMSQRIAKSEFLLSIWDRMQIFNPVHQNLVGNGAWSSAGKGPNTDEDWNEVLRYAGLFESVQVLIDDKIVEASVVDRLYSHRILALMSNDLIRAHITTRSYRWRDFMKLWETLRAQTTYRAIAAHEGEKITRAAIGDAASNPGPQADV